MSGSAGTPTTRLAEAFRPGQFACGTCQGHGWVGPRNHDDPRYNPCLTCDSTGLRPEARVELARVSREAEQHEREAVSQMQAKLDAQMALAAITEALDLKLADLGDGWTEGVKVILARIETIVDEAERAFTERDAVSREAEQLRAWAREARDDVLPDWAHPSFSAEMSDRIARVGVLLDAIQGDADALAALAAAGDGREP